MEKVTGVDFDIDLVGDCLSKSKADLSIVATVLLLLLFLDSTENNAFSLN